MGVEKDERVVGESHRRDEPSGHDAHKDSSDGGSSKDENAGHDGGLDHCRPTRVSFFHLLPLLASRTPKPVVKATGTSSSSVSASDPRGVDDGEDGEGPGEESVSSSKGGSTRRDSTRRGRRLAW